jgi:hypothetical protein
VACIVTVNGVPQDGLVEFERRAEDATLSIKNIRIQDVEPTKAPQPQGKTPVQPPKAPEGADTAP